MKNHTILFLAANPSGTYQLALDREARSIEVELKSTSYRDRFEFKTRWAAEPMDLLRALRELKPTVVHFGGHGSQNGLLFQNEDGTARLVSAEAFAETFGAVGVQVKVVVLDGCYSEAQAKALLAHVDCVVGTPASTTRESARSFAIGFYGGLGEQASVTAAYNQGRVAIGLVGSHEGDRVRLEVRAEVDPDQLILAAEATRLIDFTSERQRHHRFLGREDVLARLNEWLDGPDETRWVLVTGGPGMGKSAILSAWLARREAAGATVPHHFIRRQVADWDQPEVIAASLAAQIESAFPELRDAEAKPERRLIELLGRVSARLGPSGRLVVLVDGLDETHAEPGENPLPRFLPHVVPTGIRFLCATRPIYPHLSWLEERNSVRRLDLDDPQWAQSNEAVVSDFWKVVALEYERPLPAEMVAEAIARAEGNVLHAVMLHDALRDSPGKERHVDSVPRGLKALLGGIFEQIASHPAVRAGLGALCAAHEALSLDMLAELVAWSYEEKKRFVREARQLLLKEPAAWAGADAYRLRHDWVREFIAEDLGESTIRSYHVALSRILATWPTRPEATARQYALRYALRHRLEADDCEGAWSLAANIGFLDAKCRELGVYETETELSQAAKHCRARGAKTLDRRFNDLASALARESHRLRSVPEAIVGLLWNRLRRLGWSASDIDRQLQVPDEVTFLRVRQVAKRENPALIRELKGHIGDVTACAVTPDGRRVVSASQDKTLKVWDFDSGRELATLQGHAYKIYACVVTPDGRRVVSASQDKTLKVWDLDSGRELATFRGHADWVYSCALTSDGRMVSASRDGMLKIWDLDSMCELATLSLDKFVVNAFAVTPDGRRVVSAVFELKVWEIDSGHELTTLKGHRDWVYACAATPDGRRVVSASGDKTLKVWDLDSGHTLATLEGHTSAVRACAVTSDGRRVVSASKDRSLKIWELDSGRALATLEGHASDVTACVVTPDGRCVVSASNDHTLKIWDLDSAYRFSTPDGHVDRVSACVLTPDGRRVVSASYDHTLKVWDLDSGNVLRTLRGHADRVSACAVTPDGRQVVSASYDHTLKVWDLDSGRELATLDGQAGGVNACSITADGHLVISASHGNTPVIYNYQVRVFTKSNAYTLKIWDLNSGREVGTLDGHTGWVYACAVISGERHVVSASEDRTLKVWDLDSGRTLATLNGHTGHIISCAVTPDGRRVVSASEDQTLKVWDLDSKRELATLKGHSDEVTACAVTPDGRRMVSASLDETLRVWDLETFSCLLTHRGDVAYHAVAANATIVMAGDVAGGLWFLDWSRIGPRTYG